MNIAYLRFPTTPEELAYIADLDKSPKMFDLGYPHPRSCPRFEACLTDFVWSNLALLKATDCYIDDRFLATILGPSRYLRDNLQVFDLPQKHLTSPFVFLFEAAHFVDSIGIVREWVKVDVDYPQDEDAGHVESWERHVGGREDEEAWDWTPGSKTLHEKARFDFGVW